MTKLSITIHGETPEELVLGAQEIINRFSGAASTIMLTGSREEAAALTEKIAPKNDSLSQSDETPAQTGKEVDPESNPTGVELDKDGIPWNEEIHSSNRKMTAKGVWQRRRGITDGKYEEVKEQLLEVMAIPNETPGATPSLNDGEDLAEDISNNWNDFVKFLSLNVPTQSAFVQVATPANEEDNHVELIFAADKKAMYDGVNAEIIEQYTKLFTGREIKVSLTLDVVEETAPAGSVTNFQELIDFVTENEIPKDTINKVLSDFGIAKLGLVAAREDLVPAIYEKLEIFA